MQYREELRPTVGPAPSPLFFRCGAVAAMLAVIGIVTAQMVLNPSAPGQGLEALIRAYADSTVQRQSLTILLQVMAMFVALIVLAVKLFPIAPGLVILAGTSLVMWQMLEIVPRSIDYFVFSLGYARDYVAGAGDPIAIEGEFRRFLAWEHGWRSMRQVVWAAGLLLIGVAALRAPGFGSVLGTVLVLNGMRVAALLAASLAGGSVPFGRPLFIIVNVVAFGSLAAWLWVSPKLERPT